ncbi:MAG: phospholipase D-like domain-containing protein [Gemmatimonadaceae bacterium]
MENGSVAGKNVGGPDRIPSTVGVLANTFPVLPVLPVLCRRTTAGPRHRFLPPVLKIIAFIVLGLILAAFAVIGLLYVTRGTPLQSVRAVGDDSEPPAVTDPQFRHTAELLSKMSIQPGNSADILLNGDETYPRLWEDLRSARKSITLQLYYVRPGRMADTLRTILLERSRAGVHVLFLHDAFGSSDIGEEYLASLRQGGVRVAVFRPIHWYSIDKATSRSHIRVVVVDGEIGYTGGFGIDDKWFGDGHTVGEWRDTNVRFRGPAVMQLQATFAAGWVEATGVLLVGDLFFPAHEFTEDDGPYLAALLHASPTVGSTAAERFLALSIAGARRSLYISNSYFVPDDDFRRLLTTAAQSGVDVRILTASEKTDIKATWRAGRYRYEELLSAGVRVYEYQPAMMHAKTFVVDGVWSSIGTMNIDNRSLAFNDESNLVVAGAEFGSRLEAVFLDDLRYSHEFTLEEWRERPWTERVKEWIANTMSRLL